jgi:hypothetical protein
LDAVNRIARNVLLQWIAQKTGDRLDSKLLAMDDIKIDDTRSVEAVLTLPAQRLVQIIPNPEKSVVEHEADLKQT